MSTICSNLNMNNFQHSCRYMHAGDTADQSNPANTTTAMLPGVDLFHCQNNMNSNDVMDTPFLDESFEMIAMAMLEEHSLPDTGGGPGGGGEDLMAGYPASVDTESPVSTPSPHYHPATPTYPHPNHFHFPEPVQHQHSPHNTQLHHHIPEHLPDVSFCIKQEDNDSNSEYEVVKPRRGARRVSRTDDLGLMEGPDTERKERRRQQNRMAARRCRERKKVQRTAIIKEYYELVSANAELQSRIQHLEVEKNRLHDTLQRHRTSCSLQF